ncbi:Ion transporter [Flavobacterium longum]|uniref:ion transporter n=1 Tax=Flavobacterium longum TaxID=1299340 RepID=UPI0039EA171E
MIPEKLRHRLHTIIHEADTPSGKAFDLILLALIVISIIAVMLESVVSIRLEYGNILSVVEWIITIFFTLEYIGRLLSVRSPLKYACSFYGIIDLLATLPGYIDLFFPGWHFLLALRAIRLLRIFRILKLVHFVGAGNLLIVSLRKSRAKILVFVFTVLVLCIILGTIMYMVEGPESGFTNIPVSIYWTIVTLTTVGFGDITPVTPLGQFISSIIMIMGYGIIAVPTGIVTSEFIARKSPDTNTQSCPDCSTNDHKDGANFCYHCGKNLHK